MIYCQTKAKPELNWVEVTLEFVTRSTSSGNNIALALKVCELF